MEQGWKKQAKADIIEHGVCNEYKELVTRAASKVEVLALSKRGIDWCLENNSPALGLLRKSKDDCEASGIFIDRHFDGEVLDDQQVYVFHHCTGTIRTGLNLNKRIIPMLYFANGCSMAVEPSSDIQACVPLYIFGGNDIVASGSLDAKIYRK